MATQFQGVPGPSQDDFDTLNSKITPYVTQHKRETTLSTEGTYTPTEDCYLSIIVTLSADSNNYHGIAVKIGNKKIASIWEKTANAKDISIGFYAKAGTQYTIAANGQFPSSVDISEWR